MNRKLVWLPGQTSFSFPRPAKKSKIGYRRNPLSHNPPISVRQRWHAEQLKHTAACPAPPCFPSVHGPPSYRSGRRLSQTSPDATVAAPPITVRQRRFCGNKQRRRKTPFRYLTVAAPPSNRTSRSYRNRYNTVKYHAHPQQIRFPKPNPFAA